MIYKKIKDKDREIKKPVIPLILLFTVIVSGTIGYELLWHESDTDLIDSIYMTIITITTVGYEEVFPLNDTGRVFTMFIAVFGIGSLFYLFGVFMENLFTIQVLNLRGRKKMKKEIKELRDHIIIIGYGKVGRLAVQELTKRDKDLVIIDKDFGDNFVDRDNLYAIEDNAEDDETLKFAGIDRAKSLIVAIPDSSTTLFIVLSARELNPDLFIVARCDNANIEKKLITAGADRSINPFSAGGQKMANIAVNPQIMDFIESSFKTGSGEDLKIEKFQLKKDSNFNNKTLEELNIRQETGVSIIGIIRDEIPNINPDSNFKIKSGDQLITLGTVEQIDKFNDYCN